MRHRQGPPRDTTEDPAVQSVSRLRRRYLEEGETPTQDALALLQTDPRAGARALGELLLRRGAAAAATSRRLGTMLHLERELARQGAGLVAGVDEAGVGPLAGPVIAAAVIFATDAPILPVKDSKMLSPCARASLAARIRDCALVIGVGRADVWEIATLNVYHATLLAMRRAVDSLAVVPGHVLVDARVIPGLGMPQTAVIRGDAKHYSIAAASIVAKTRRDALMEDLDARYPAYGFARHKGYGTAEHRDAIRRYGPCPEHRMSYAALVEILSSGNTDRDASGSGSQARGEPCSRGSCRPSRPGSRSRSWRGCSMG